MPFPTLEWLSYNWSSCLSTRDGFLSGCGFNSVSLKGERGKKKKKPTTQTLLNVANQAFSKLDWGWNVKAVFDVILKCCSRTVLPPTANCLTVPIQWPFSPEQPPIKADPTKLSKDTWCREPKRNQKSQMAHSFTSNF